MIFDKTEMIGILDLRSLGYYNIIYLIILYIWKQDVLQWNLGKHYHFDSAEDICNQFNRFVNLLKKEEENSKKNILGMMTDKRM